MRSRSNQTERGIDLSLPPEAVSLRTLLIQGAKSAVFTAHRRSDRLSRWIVQLRERVGWQKPAVALATIDPFLKTCARQTHHTGRTGSR